MIINDLILNADCETILIELQRQLKINQIPYLQKTKDGGKNIQVQCPYHGNGQERRPSAGIRKQDGLFHCFACNQSHTLPEVISYVFGHEDMFGEWGMKWLAKNFATVRIEERKDVEIDMERNNITDKNNLLGNIIHSKPNTFVTEEELDSYRYYHQYWTERGITAEWLIELFDLGYDKKTDCITFPVRDIDGNCLFVARRSVKTKWFNYPKDVEKPLYGIYELKQKGVYDFYGATVFITESMIDCLRLWQNHRLAIALNGTGSSEQFEQIRKMPIRKIVLATDSDMAGIKARAKIRVHCTNKLITEVILPDGRKDIGECTDEEIQNLKEVF